MADDARHAKPDLIRGAAPEATDFFELLRQLEADGRRIGRAGGPDREPVRLGQNVRMSFAASDVAGISKSDAQGTPHVAVNVIGLLGPEGPMPLHLTRWILERASNRWFAGDSEGATSDTTFLDFCNMLQHRMIAFYWRAWADSRPEVQVGHHGGGQVAALLRALAGIGLPTLSEGTSARASVKLRHATDLAQSVQSPDRLAGYLATVTGAPVRLVEFIGVWTDIPRRLQSRIGDHSAVLGRTAVVGSRVFERQGRAELCLGPLDLESFVSFLEEGRHRADLRHAILHGAGHDMEFDLRLSLRAEDVPAPRLGSIRLGQTSWLASKVPRDADDYHVRSFSSRGLESAGVAA